MTEYLFSLVAQYGLPVVFLTAYLSCLGIPFPTFAVLLAGGAFAAAGDLDLWSLWLLSFLGAVGGDNTGYLIGRRLGEPFLAKFRQRRKAAAVLLRAEQFVQRRGAIGVFFSHWLVAALGPYVNFICGSVGFSWARFVVWDVFAEAIWVSIYILLGYLFGSNLNVLVTLVGEWGGFITAGAGTILLGIFLMRTVWVRAKRIRARTGDL
ncbi:MAG: VTT domain-containing protein [Rhodobacteraceae bacterium]|nr:VTT domain-containing protein [Paracoccaceae bacterium]